MVLNRTYYFVSYYDLDLSIPMFDTYIYIGRAEDPNEKDKGIMLNLFQEPSTYVLKGVKGKETEIWDSDLEADDASLNRFYDLHRLIGLLTELRAKSSN